MLFSTLTHAVLLTLGLIAIPATGLLLAHKKAGAAILLWLIPVALTASAADLALSVVETVRPGTSFHAAPGGALRLGIAAFLLLPPVEVFYQRIVTHLAGGGVQVAARGAWGEDATPTDPADSDEDDHE